MRYTEKQLKDLVVIAKIKDCFARDCSVCSFAEKGVNYPEVAAACILVGSLSNHKLAPYKARNSIRDMLG